MSKASRPQLPRRAATIKHGESHAVDSPKADRKLIVVAGAWTAAFLGYLVLFYITPVFLIPEDPLVHRAVVLIWILTPEFFWDTWTADRVLPLGGADRLPVILTTSLILAWGGGLGWSVLAITGATQRLSRMERFVLAEGVGLHLLSLLTLAAGLAGWLSRPVAWIGSTIAVTAILIGLAVWKARARKGDNSTVSRREESPVESAHAQSLSPAWIALGAPAIMVIFLGAMLPPWEFDTREYHLQVPKEWFRQGRIDFLPHNVYGNMPLGAEMHAVLAMGLMPGERSWWWGALAGKTVMAAFAPLTALGLFAAGRRFFSPLAGVVAAAIYIAIPWIVHNAVTGMNDHVLACYVFLAFYALLLWRGEGEPGSLLLLSGLLTGAAAACKYTGLLFAGAPLGLLAIYFALRPRRQPTEPANTTPPSPHRGVTRVPLIACGFALTAALSGGLWYAKNAVQTGNPVYPLLYEIFGGRTWTAEKAERWNRAHQVPRSAELGPYAPQRLIASAAEVGWRSEWLSPVLAPLLVLAPLQRSNRWALGWIAAFTFFLLAAWWLFTHRIDRFWIPALPTAALLAGAGAGWSADQRWRNAMLGVAAAGVAANFLIIASPWIGDNRFFVALEALRTDAVHPVTGGPGRVNRAHLYLNQTVPKGGAVLLVGDAQVFDLEPTVFYNTCFDDCVFTGMMKGRSAEERRAALQENNITHVYVLWPEIARYRSPGNYGYWDYVQPRVFDELVEQGVLAPAWPMEAYAISTTHYGYPPPRVYEVVSARKKAG